MKQTPSLSSTHATRMIRNDHAQVMELFHKLDSQTTDMVRTPIVRAICAALEVHAQVEEELFYPLLRECGINSPALDNAVPGHDKMRSLIDRVRSLEGQRAPQEDAFHELLNAVMHHVADEETQLLPAAERFLSAERLCEVGATMATRHKELARPRAAELATAAAVAAPAKTALVTVGALLAGTMLLRGLRRGRMARSSY